MKYKRLADLPPIVRTFLYSFNGYMVGGSCKFILGDTDIYPKDFDIIIPFKNWNDAMKAIPKNSKTNTWGGIKIEQPGLVVDIWCQDIADYLNNISTPDFYILHPKTMTTLRGKVGYD